MFTSPDEHHIDPRSPGTPGGQSDYKKAATTSKPKSNFLLNSATVDVVLISFFESNKSLSQNLKPQTSDLGGLDLVRVSFLAFMPP